MSIEEGQRVSKGEKTGEVLVIFKDTGFIRWDGDPLSLEYCDLDDLTVLPDNSLEE